MFTAQLISISGNLKKTPMLLRMRVSTYIYIYMCVNRSRLAHTRADIYVVLVMRAHTQVQLVESFLFLFFFGGGVRF